MFFITILPLYQVDNHQEIYHRPESDSFPFAVRKGLFDAGQVVADADGIGHWPDITAFSIKDHLL